MHRSFRCYSIAGQEFLTCGRSRIGSVPLAQISLSTQNSLVKLFEMKILCRTVSCHERIQTKKEIEGERINKVYIRPQIVYRHESLL